jgi:predicted nucleic acid-binding protein
MPSGPKPRRYIDADVLVSYIENVPDRADLIEGILEDAAEGRIEIVTSLITMVEVLFAEGEKRRKKLSKSVTDKINKLWQPSSPIEVVEVSEFITRGALDLLRNTNVPKNWTGLGPNDGIHLITAKREKCVDLFTYSHDFKRYEKIMGYKIGPPFRDPPEEKAAPDPQMSLADALLNKDEPSESETPAVAPPGAREADLPPRPEA